MPTNNHEYMSVKSVEIFSTGLITDSEGVEMDWTVKDLKSMADNFEAAPLKAGHSDDDFNTKIADAMGIPQPLVTGHDRDGTGQMRLGHLENLRVKGNKLLADLEDVPDPIGELIKSGAYNSVSSEIVIDEDGTPSIKGLALLGVENPAVPNLQSISDAKLSFTAPMIIRTKEVTMPKKKEAHLAAVDAALTESLRIELARRQLKGKKPSVDDFEQEVERISGYEGVSFNVALGICSKEYPVAFKQYVKRVQAHVNQVAEQQGMYNEAEQFAASARYIATVAERENLSIYEATKLVSPKIRAIFQVGMTTKSTSPTTGMNQGGN